MQTKHQYNQCRHGDAHYIAPSAPFHGRACCKALQKAIVHQGPDGTLYTTWGWGGGYSEPDRPDGLRMDIHHYGKDSHEVFFAYSN